jgi:hypothetical protein
MAFEIEWMAFEIEWMAFKIEALNVDFIWCVRHIMYYDDVRVGF